MITLTKEWLQQTIAELEEERDATPGAVNEDAAKALAAMKLALASLEAEESVPDELEETRCDGIRKCIAALRYHHKRAETFSNGYTGSTLEDDTLKSINLLRAQTLPPALVSVPDELTREEYKRRFMEDDDFDGTFRGGWNACRAAMLQGAEPASNRDELPLDYLQGQKDGLEWAAQLAEANHPHTGDWLYDDPLELAKAIRKGPDMPEPDGNSPVIPDGWVACSERMPEEDGNYWGWWSESKRQGPVWFIKSELQAQFQSSEITHWMPLPAAPH